jgi:hypothetical protein
VGGDHRISAVRRVVVQLSDDDGALRETVAPGIPCGHDDERRDVGESQIPDDRRIISPARQTADDEAGSRDGMPRKLHLRR